MPRAIRAFAVAAAQQDNMPFGKFALLLVRTAVRPSPIHGLGCFTCEPIRSGTVIWQLNALVDISFSGAQILAMPESFQIFLAQYASKDFGLDRYVFCSDNARFINHAVPPNLTHNAPSSAEKIFANKDISAGEELTLDYQFVDDPNEAGNVLTEIGLRHCKQSEMDPRIKKEHDGLP